MSWDRERGAEFLAVANRAADAVAVVLESRPARPEGTGGAPTEIKDLDEAAEAAALTELEVLDMPVLSEEAGLIGALPGPGEPWIALDPIDGTRNCLHGYPPWSVAIGVVVDEEPVAGLVVDLSCSRRWWSANAGEAFSDARPIATRAGGLVILPSSAPDDLRPLGLGPDYPRARLAGSTAVDLCRVADGSAGAFVDWDRAISQAHDIAASLAILRAAGGNALTREGAPVRLPPDRDIFHHVIAAASSAEANQLAARVRERRQRGG